MKKRLLSLLLALVMLVGMIPATSLTAFAAAGPEVYVGGVGMCDGDYLAVGATTTQTTKPSGGYAYYKDGTLTLNNYSYTGVGCQESHGVMTLIYSMTMQTVRLVGSNYLTAVSSTDEIAGICADTGLTINADSGASLTIDSSCIGIYVDEGSLVFNGGDINASGDIAGIFCHAGDITINNSDITATGANGIITNKNLIVNSGYVEAIAIDTAYDDARYAIAIPYNGVFTVADWRTVLASTTADGELGEYTAANHNTYKKIVITPKPRINNVNVSATFSGTPAKATTSTTGATVTATTWYRKNGSGWTELGASDTIKEDYTYRCEVTVGATGDYVFADGYTVKINGIAATKKSGNTWYVDRTITGYTSYVDVYDIALPEVGVHPDFTFNDEDCRNSSVALVEWFECDKDGKKLSGALSADYKFKEDAYYRLEVTAVPDANYEFDTRTLGFYIGPKTVQYYYPYQDTTYPGSVTGWKVYHVDDANGTYTVQIGDITLKDGDYLANNATSVTTVKPVDGYAYYKDGVLTLNNFVAAKLVRYYERYLEVELIGENKIGAIADYYYWDGNASNDYYTGLEFRGTGNLEFGNYYDDPYCNVSVNGDVFFNGSGDILLDAEFNCFQYTDNVIINDGYVYCYTSQDSVFGDDTIIEVNGGKLKLFDGGCWDKFLCNGTLTIAAGSVYVNVDPRKIELEDCVPWDGVTDLNTYDCVWIVPKPNVYVGGVGMYDGDYLAVGATTTQTTKPSGGYAYYEDGTLTLDNYSYEGDGYEYDNDEDYYAVIYSKNDLTLELIGNNTLDQTTYNSDMIYVDDANLTVGGDGKLTGTSDGFALYAYKGITINGGTIEVSTYYACISSYGGEVIINGGDITAESDIIDAIYSYYDVTVNGGNVTAIGGRMAISCGSSNSFTVAEGTNIQASTTVDGELGEYVAENYDSYKKIVIKTPGVFVGGVAMYDGDYLAVGATTTQTTKPSGGYAYYKNGKLTLNNYSCEGKGYQYNSEYGYYAVIYSKNDLTLELIGNNTLTQTDSDSDLIYVYGANLTVGGDGKLTGTSGGYALCADGGLTINGGTIELSTYFTCILSYGEVIINDGDITAESEDRTGIYSKYDVTVNGGNVTAIGGGGAISCGSSGSFTVAEGLTMQASTTVDGELGEYVAENHDIYEKIVIKTPDVYVVGDVNADGLVNAKDALLLRKSIAAGNASSLDLKVADVNGDGVINAKDVVKLRRIVTGGYN